MYVTFAAEMAAWCFISGCCCLYAFKWDCQDDWSPRRPLPSLLVSLVVARARVRLGTAGWLAGRAGTATYAPLPAPRAFPGGRWSAGLWCGAVSGWRSAAASGDCIGAPTHGLFGVPAAAAELGRDGEHTQHFMQLGHLLHFFLWHAHGAAVGGRGRGCTCGLLAAGRGGSACIPAIACFSGSRGCLAVCGCSADMRSGMLRCRCFAAPAAEDERGALGRSSPVCRCGAVQISRCSRAGTRDTRELARRCCEDKARGGHGSRPLRQYSPPPPLPLATGERQPQRRCTRAGCSLRRIPHLCTVILVHRDRSKAPTHGRARRIAPPNFPQPFDDHETKK